MMTLLDLVAFVYFITLSECVCVGGWVELQFLGPVSRSFIFHYNDIFCVQVIFRCLSRYAPLIILKLHSQILKSTRQLQRIKLNFFFIYVQLFTIELIYTHLQILFVEDKIILTASHVIIMNTVITQIQIQKRYLSEIYTVYYSCGCCVTDVTAVENLTAYHQSAETLDIKCISSGSYKTLSKKQVQ